MEVLMHTQRLFLACALIFSSIISASDTIPVSKIVKQKKTQNTASKKKNGRATSNRNVELSTLVKKDLKHKKAPAYRPLDSQNQNSASFGKHLAQKNAHVSELIQHKINTSWNETHLSFDSNGCNEKIHKDSNRSHSEHVLDQYNNILEPKKDHDNYDVSSLIQTFKAFSENAKINQN